jgi:hypothetical protein
MKNAFAAAILICTAGSAFAQTTSTPANHDAHTPAVATSNTVNPGAPVAGANSFTESQAKSRMEAAGYSDVTGLAKDKDGVWRGKASKAGAPTEVTLDFQGNVTSKMP